MSAHGTYARYTAGCRCHDCREASRVYHMGWRRSRGVKPKKVGRTCGLIATYNDGCRCDDCRRAAREKQARYRARKRAA